MPVNFIVFDDMGINHLPMNSGVGSLNSLWLPLQIYSFLDCVLIPIKGLEKDCVY